MKHLLGFAMTLCFIVLTFMSGRYITASESRPGLYLAVILMLLAQSCLWIGGEFSPGIQGKVGIWRSLAMTVFIVQTITVPLTLFQIFFRRIAYVGDDEVGLLSRAQLAWALTGGLTAAFLSLIAKKRWWRMQGGRVAGT